MIFFSLVVVPRDSDGTHVRDTFPLRDLLNAIVLFDIGSHFFLFVVYYEYNGSIRCYILSLVDFFVLE